MTRESFPIFENPPHLERGIKIDGTWRRDWYELLEDQAFAAWLRENHIKIPMFEYGHGIYRMTTRGPLNPDPDLHLPNGHWYKGGCARELFFEKLGIPCPKARDIDIVQNENVTTESPEHPLLALADDIDTIGGYTETDEGEREVNEHSFEEYFFSRDFTINEVLANDHEIYFTKAALMDACRRIIRPTSHQAYTARSDRHRTGIKTLAKAIRFSVDLSLADITNPNGWMIDPSIDTNFTQEFLEEHPLYIFLHLDRALKDGIGRGEAYLFAWQEMGFFRDCETVQAFADRLSQRIPRHFIPRSPFLEYDYDLATNPTRTQWFDDDPLPTQRS